MSGDELKEWLKKQGIELTDLANKLNISKQNLNSKLKIKDVGIGLVKDIANTVNKSVYEIIDSENHNHIVNDDSFRYNKAVEFEDHSMSSVPLIPVEAMAGFASGEVCV